MTVVLIIGSGASGVQAAQQLLERGLEVRMIDTGERSAYHDNLLPQKTFSDLRHSDAGQHRYFLGDQLEDISFADIRSSHKLPPLKRYVISDETTTTTSGQGDFVLRRTKARGGLAMSWGAGAMPLRESDFAHLPFSSNDLAPYYDRVTDDVCLSGNGDDFSDVLSPPKGMQPPLELDTPGENLLEQYQKDREQLQKHGLHMGRSWLAVCSEQKADRDPCAYRDMEFWGDADSAVYRPEWTLRKLESHAGFTYLGGLEATRFESSQKGVSVSARNTKTGEAETISGDALILAAGVPGSAKLAMRAGGFYGEEHAVPVRTNAYTYVPCLYPKMLAHAMKDKRSSLAQLSSLFNPDGPEGDPEKTIFSSIFSYRSMLTYKLLKEGPMPYALGLDLFRLLLPAMVIVTIFHHDGASGTKKFWIDKPDDTLESEVEHIVYDETPDILEQQNRAEKSYLAKLRKLGLYAIKRLRRSAGSSIHYTGTLPYSDDDKPLSCDAAGRLRPYSRVWVADGSALPFMPALLPTFTIMANARRVADNLASSLKSS